MHQIEKQEGNPFNVSLYGQARTRESWAITTINLLLHNISDFDIRLGDILREPELVQKDGKLRRFDRVIANLPFNIDNWAGDKIAELNREKYNRFCYGIPPNNNGNYAFIQHIIATLKETGRAAVLIPHGVLFRSGAEAEIRGRIVRDDLIEAVIGLAPKLFFGTSILAVILVLNKNKEEERRKKILFIDASDDYQVGRKQNYLEDKDIARIISAYQNFPDEAGYAKVVSIEELAANDYMLDIKRYVTSPKPNVELEAEINKLRQLKAERTKVESEMNECLRALGIKI
jgi:type I restriction enzyme M protein